jgi:hypothetical protein
MFHENLRLTAHLVETNRAGARKGKKTNAD